MTGPGLAHLPVPPSPFPRRCAISTPFSGSGSGARRRLSTESTVLLSLFLVPSPDLKTKSCQVGCNWCIPLLWIAAIQHQAYAQAVKSDT